MYLQSKHLAMSSLLLSCTVGKILFQDVDNKVPYAIKLLDPRGILIGYVDVDFK